MSWKILAYQILAQYQYWNPTSCVPCLITCSEDNIKIVLGKSFHITEWRGTEGDDFTLQSLLIGWGEYCSTCAKSFIQVFCGSKGCCLKWCQLHQLGIKMPGLKMRKIWACEAWKERAYWTSVDHSSSLPEDNGQSLHKPVASRFAKEEEWEKRWYLCFCYVGFDPLFFFFLTSHFESDNVIEEWC